MEVNVKNVKVNNGVSSPVIPEKLSSMPNDLSNIIQCAFNFFTLIDLDLVSENFVVTE